MRITFLLSRFLNGGIDTVLVRYLQGIDCVNNDVTFVIGSEYKGMQPFEPFIPQNVKVKYLLREGMQTRLPKRKLSKSLNTRQKVLDAVLFAPVRGFIQKIRLKRLLKDEDVVVDFDTTFYSRLKGIKARKIAFFHFSINHYHRGNERKIKRLCRKMMTYDDIVLISKQMADEFAARVPRMCNKISVIYNPVSEENLLAKAAEYAVPTEDYILSVARLEERQKDFTTLIKAYAIANGQTPLPKLYIIGEGRDKDRLKALAQKCGVENKIVFKGFLPNPMPWIANSKLFVLSSKFEGLPTVLIEALTLRKIIVSSDCPTGPAEILDNGNCGVLTPVGDAEAMAKALIRALNDDELRSNIASNIEGHKKIFSAQYCIGQFMRLCNGGKS